jgi:hypothetical protein
MSHTNRVCGDASFEGALERANEPFLPRPIQDREDHLAVGAPEVLCQRLPKQAGDLDAVVAERAASPGAQHDAVVPRQHPDCEHLEHP